ncbi:MAG TPA: nuclear transport factor 2 family protein [Rubricoccaceae bacterium]|jgi:hypothetical protein
MSPADFTTRHADALLAADADAIAALYTDDATLVALDGVAEGREAVRERYATFFAYHGAITFAETTHSQATEDAAFTRLKVESERGTFSLINVFELDGDVCRRHFSNEIEVTLNRDEVERDM